MAKNAVVGIEISGMAKLRGLVKAAGDAQHPEWQAGARRATDEFRGLVASRAPGSMGGKTAVKRSATLLGPTVGAVGTKHPGAKVVEFGRGALVIRPRRARVLWWRGAAHPVASVSQAKRAARPFYGIVRGDAATGAMRPRLETILAAAIERVWGSAGPDGSD
jgi:hypothetical protein